MLLWGNSSVWILCFGDSFRNSTVPIRFTRVPVRGVGSTLSSTPWTTDGLIINVPRLYSALLWGLSTGRKSMGWSVSSSPVSASFSRLSLKQPPRIVIIRIASVAIEIPAATEMAIITSVDIWSSPLDDSGVTSSGSQLPLPSSGLRDKHWSEYHTGYMHCTSELLIYLRLSQASLTVSLS